MSWSLLGDYPPHLHVDFHVLPETNTTMDNEPTFLLSVNKLRIECSEELYTLVSNELRLSTEPLFMQ